MTRGKCLFVVLLALACSTPAGATATSSGEAEVQMTLASLAYQSKDYTRCRKIANELLEKDAGNSGARELLALSQKASGDEDGAANTYERLISTGPEGKRPAYHFELGTIRYKQKKADEARRHFDLAARGDFNPGTSHFYLGILEFNAKEWRKAKAHLAAALAYNDAQSMTPVTRYYLANAYAQLGQTEAAVHNYHEASESAESAKTSNSGVDSLVDGIRTSALKELKNLDKDQKYANITLTQQFNSNVQANPSEVNNPVASSSQRSGEAILSISAGYSTSPTRNVQVTPTFSYFTNYNYNYLARGFNFMSFTPALFTVYKPYERLSAGIKADGTFSMQNMLQSIDSTRSLKYRPYSLTGDIGPIVKYELSPRVSLGVESYYRPTDFYLDPATGDSRRSGGGVFSKVSAEYVSGYTWWTPSAYLSYEWVHPSGITYRSYNYGAGLADTVSATEKLTLTGTVDVVYYDYFLNVPERLDVNLVFRVAGTYALMPHWSLVGDISYTDNESSISASFKYDRWVVDGGFTYSF